MPVVLATGAATASGHDYADELGTSYEFPNQYRRSISEGDVFVYYRGRRRSGGGQQLQVYLGIGVIGAVGTGRAPRLLQCSIEQYRPFSPPVFFKRPDGSYFEPGGIRRGYFQPGVRRIPDEVWEAIAAAGGVGPDEAIAVEIAPGRYAPAAEARLVELVSRRAVLAALRLRPDVYDVIEMPLNNPGYDLRAETPAGSLYVEVKGTQSGIPTFFLSESERTFAVAHADAYLLAVVTDVVLPNETWGGIRYLSDPPDADNSHLRPHQWRGQLS